MYGRLGIFHNGPCSWRKLILWYVAEHLNVHILNVHSRLLQFIFVLSYRGIRKLLTIVCYSVIIQLLRHCKLRKLGSVRKSITNSAYQLSDDSPSLNATVRVIYVDLEVIGSP
jgi:hypothetical protein